MSEDIFDGYGIRVKLKVDFNNVRETLTRIGLANRKTKTLVQSCHLFHKRGEYAIMHFLEMFQFDGKEANFTEEDEGRRNRIVKLLEEWDLIEILPEDQLDDEDIVCPPNMISIISRKEVVEGWNLVHKYTLGKKS